MKQYIDIVKHVLENGKEKRPVRKDKDGKFVPVDGGVMTLACPNVAFSHDMSNGFPLLTTKKMAWKAIRVELEGFIKAITDKRWYEERVCKIWSEWANPEHVNQLTEVRENPNNLEIRKEYQKAEHDLGPIYGYQWRKFNKTYTDGTIGNQSEDDGDYSNYTDQLKNIVDTLRTNPMDRRMVCSAWNPNQMHMMALPPCHWGWNVTVIGDELNLFWVQRSCDLMLGVPFNIASYGLLLELLAQDAGLKVGNLSAMFVDCHIYENQIEAAKEQVTREPNSLPIVKINNNVEESSFDIFEWDYKNVVLLDYNPLSKIDFGKVTV